MRHRSSLARALVAVVSLAVGAAPASAQYAFTAVARSADGFDPFAFGQPALSGNGALAFTAGLADGTTVLYRFSGGALQPVASTASFFSRFGDVSINDAGQIGFEGSFEDVLGEGIFRADGTTITTIAGTRNAGAFDFVNASPSLNAVGRMAFIGALEQNFVDGVFAGDGGPVETLYDDTGEVDSFNNNPSLNDLGFVAFGGLRAADGAEGIFLGNGGPITTLADDTDGFFTFFFDPSLNNSNAAAFYAVINGGTGQGIFLAQGGAVTPILQGGFDQFLSFGFNPSLNNLGQVAYVVEPTFGNQILAVGSDPVAGRVIGSGDTLFGQTVTGVSLWREGLNDAGQVAFTAFFEDGSAGIFLATPTTATPEPVTLVLVGAGLFAIGLRRWRGGRDAV
jgi:hypothetical protein